MFLKKKIETTSAIPLVDVLEAVVEETSVTTVATVKSDSIEYPAEVQQIHREFHCAAEKLVEDAEIILKQAGEKDVEKIKRLNKLGFSNNIQTKEAELILKKAEMSEKDLKYLKHYQQHYPLNKFITEVQVKTICLKYNLICGEVSRFKGFVPEKNLEEIERFKVKKEDCVMKTYSIGKYKDYKEEVRDDNGRSAYQYYSLYDAEQRPASLNICAPMKDMDTTGMRIIDGYKMEKHIPDPVVLQPVHGGYLILTAWGDEASDPLVVNEINN